MFKSGDQVRVTGNTTVDQFQQLQVGMTATVSCIWDEQEYSIELDGHSEHVRPDELELI